MLHVITIYFYLNGFGDRSGLLAPIKNIGAAGSSGGLQAPPRKVALRALYMNAAHRGWPVGSPFALFWNNLYMHFCNGELSDSLEVSLDSLIQINYSVADLERLGVIIIPPEWPLQNPSVGVQ